MDCDRTRRIHFMQALERLKALADSGKMKKAPRRIPSGVALRSLEKEGLELCKKEEAVLERLGEVTVELNKIIDELKARE